MKLSSLMISLRTARAQSAVLWSGARARPCASARAHEGQQHLVAQQRLLLRGRPQRGALEHPGEVQVVDDHGGRQAQCARGRVHGHAVRVPRAAGAQQVTHQMKGFVRAAALYTGSKALRAQRVLSAGAAAAASTAAHLMLGSELGTAARAPPHAHETAHTHAPGMARARSAGVFAGSHSVTSSS